MKILKAVLFSTVFLAGVHECSASLSLEQIDALQQAPRPLNLLRKLQGEYSMGPGTPLYNRFYSSLNGSQTAAQQMAGLGPLFNELRAEARARVAAAPALGVSGGAHLSIAGVQEDLVASVGNVVVASPRAMPDADPREQSLSKKLRSEQLAEEEVPQPMFVVDSEEETLKRGRAALQSQISDLENHAEDLRGRYSAALASFQTHQEERAHSQGALTELQRIVAEKKEALSASFQMKQDWIGKVQNAYGAWGVSFLNNEGDQLSFQQDLDSAMQEIYGARDLESQEAPRQRIQDILAGPNLGLKRPCPLPDLFYKINILKNHWESLQGKPAFSTTLQTPEVQNQYRIVAGILPKIVEFNQVLVGCLKPEHLDFHKITAKSSAVLGALTEKNDEALGNFLQADGFEQHKEALQAKNYGASLLRITGALKDAASKLATAKANKNQEQMKDAVATLTAAGLPSDVSKWTLDAIEEAIDNQADTAVAQISVESFKETTLPQIYAPTLESLTAQWDDAQQKRLSWLDQIRVLLSDNDGKIEHLQSQIPNLEAQVQGSQSALSDLDGGLEQESQELGRLQEESQSLAVQLESLRQQRSEGSL